MSSDTKNRETPMIPGVYRRGNNKYRIEIYIKNSKNESVRFRRTITLEDGMSNRDKKRTLTELKLDFEKEMIVSMNSGGVVIKNQTLSEFISYWRKMYAVSNLQLKTLERYDELAIRIEETLGEIRLSELTPAHFNQFYNTLQTSEKRRDLLYVAEPLLKETLLADSVSSKDLAEVAGLNIKTVRSIIKGNPTNKSVQISEALHLERDKLFRVLSDGINDGLSNVTIKHYSQFIKAVLNKAVEWEILDRNPAAHIKLPKTKSNSSKGIRHYDRATILKLLIELESAPIKYKAMMYIAVFSGCRIGELVALEWRHINFDEYVISIEQSAQRLQSKEKIIKEPKSKAGIRNVLVPERVMEVLNEYRNWQQEEMRKIDDKYENTHYEGFLFTQVDGTILYPSTPAWWFRKFIKERGLPQLNFHGLRHTHATLLLEDGAPVNIVSNRLGHSRISTTVDTYVHVSADAAKEVVARLDSLVPNK